MTGWPRGTWRRWRPARPARPRRRCRRGSNRKRSSSARCDVRGPPVGGIAPSTRGACRRERSVALLDAPRARLARVEEEARLLARPVAREQLARTPSGARPGRTRGIIAHAACFEQRREQVGRERRGARSCRACRRARAAPARSSTSGGQRGGSPRARARPGAARPRRRDASSACAGSAPGLAAAAALDALVGALRTSSSSRRASSIRFASSFSAIARSFSTASARRAKVASSACCWIASRVGWLQRLLDLGGRRDAGDADGDDLDARARRVRARRRPRRCRSRIGATPPARIGAGRA